MTAAGKAFVQRWSIVLSLIRGGTPIYVAMSTGLEDQDWNLVFAATNRLADDIASQDDAA